MWEKSHIFYITNHQKSNTLARSRWIELLTQRTQMCCAPHVNLTNWQDHTQKKQHKVELSAGGELKRGRKWELLNSLSYILRWTERERQDHKKIWVISDSTAAAIMKILRKKSQLAVCFFSAGNLSLSALAKLITKRCSTSSTHNILQNESSRRDGWRCRLVDLHRPTSTLCCSLARQLGARGVDDWLSTAGGAGGVLEIVYWRDSIKKSCFFLRFHILFIQSKNELKNKKEIWNFHYKCSNNFLMDKHSISNY